MQCARMQPPPLSSVKIDSKHASHMNLMPCFWWGFNSFTNIASADINTCFCSKSSTNWSCSLTSFCENKSLSWIRKKSAMKHKETIVITKKEEKISKRKANANHFFTVFDALLSRSLVFNGDLCQFAQIYIFHDFTNISSTVFLDFWDFSLFFTFCHRLFYLNFL